MRPTLNVISPELCAKVVAEAGLLDGRRATVDVTLVIEYGFVVRAVTDKVRANVIGAVENLLDLEVVEVNIRVDDVYVPEGPEGQ